MQGDAINRIVRGWEFLLGLLLLLAACHSSASLTGTPLTQATSIPARRSEERSWAGCRFPQSSDVANLILREQEVLRLVAYGWDNARVADTLCITEGTVKQHVCSIYAKLNISSDTEAIAWVWHQRGVER